MGQLLEQIQESIEDAQRRKAAVEVELEALQEIEAIAAARLNGGGIVHNGAQASGPAAAPQTQRRGQTAADPPSRSRAPRPAPKTSAGRRSTSSGGRRAAAKPEETHANGAAAGGGLPGKDELLPRVVEVLDKASEPLSRSEIARQLGLPSRKGSEISRSLRVLDPALDQLRRQKRARITGTGRGGATLWARATPSDENRGAGVKPLEQAALEAAGVTETTLDDQILATLHALGPRSHRELAEDLAESEGDVGRALGRLHRGERVCAFRRPGEAKPVYQLTEV